MTPPKTGWYWHIHHDKLMEWCTGYSKRVAYIRSTKPASEIETRLRLFHPVRATLPLLMEQAGAAYKKALAAYNRDGDGDGDGDIAADHKAYATYILAGVACEQASDAYVQEVTRLHKQECPDCPWDGQTIFPKGGIS